MSSAIVKVRSPQRAVRIATHLPKEFGKILTSTINGEPWFSNGHIMFKGACNCKTTRKVIMEPVYRQATNAKLVATRGFRRNCSDFSLPVHESVVGSQFIASKYYFMIDAPHWKSYLGGKFGDGGERYIVVKDGNEIVAIIAPLRRPGDVYQYKKVPPDVAADFYKAESKGKLFPIIKRNFECECVHRATREPGDEPLEEGEKTGDGTT